MRVHGIIQAAVVGLVAMSTAASGQEYDEPPVSYRTAATDNRVADLFAAIESGERQLDHEPGFGYLRSLLKALDIPESSQALVFSKTSLQRHRITPRTPRAVYFADDVYVGFCQQGDVLEISAVDPQLGAVFYTLPQQRAERPRVVRQNDNCLICHSSGHTRDVPGHLVRSVYVDGSGQPILSSGSFRVDHTTPLADRWGGWYVTGTHGAQTHLGNLVFRSGEVPMSIDRAAGANQTDLTPHIDTSAYLTPHSDVVALMVLEHQVAVHNALTRANFLTRQALHHEQTLNRELGEPEHHVWASTRSRIQSACEPLVECLLASGEAQWTEPIKGTSGFAEEFARGGPRDPRGRSLRELDLSRRLFKYPCSYLIYSPSFQALPAEAKRYVFARLEEVLGGADPKQKFKHLSADDRQAIAEILIATLPDLPEGFCAGVSPR